MQRVMKSIAAALLIIPAAALGGHDGDPSTGNMHAMGHDEAPASLIFGPPDIHTDLAFWGKYAIQGNWNGFRILDISAPGNPKLVSFTDCPGNQGDVSVWENIVVRSTNSPQVSADCGATMLPTGQRFEGIHVFDISDKANAQLLASVATDCGSHTHTLVPDIDNDRLLVYVNSSNATCQGGTVLGNKIDIVEIPLADPASASVINSAPLVGVGDCHDLAAFTADVNLAVCAADDKANVFNISDPANPVFLYTIAEAGVGDGTIGSGAWHSTSMTWDGKVIALVWEPGGGVAAECEATDDPIKHTMFFYDSATGGKLGQWELPRKQSATENCTLHNYNVVPLRSGRYVIVHGSYQSGTSAVDFTDPANPVEIGWSDPPPIVPTDIGGAWSTYWYNNFMYESNITEGLNVFRLSDNVTGGAMRLPYLNPQTQTFRIEPKGKR